MPPVSPVQRAHTALGTRRMSGKERTITPIITRDKTSLPPININENNKNFDEDEIDSNNSSDVDEPSKFYFGEEARVDFFKLYHSDLTSKKENENKKLSSRTKYLKNCLNGNLVPDPLIIPKRACSTLNFQYYNLGDDYVRAFGESVGIVPNITVINFRGNGISSSGVEKLMEGLSSQNNTILEIDLSQNHIGIEGIKALKEFLINENNCHLTSLSLDGCALGRHSTMVLCEGISGNKTLTNLNLSNNQIEEDSGTAVGVAISCNPYLQTVDLSFNQLRGYGAASFARSLQINDSIETLNLSHNGFSNSIGQIAVQSLSSSLAINKSLVHLDLSYNHLNQEDISVIRNGLNFNRNIKGLHLYGNDGHVDSKVYAVPGPSTKNDLPENYFCWVCQNYQEILFTFTMEEANNKKINKNKDLLIKLEIDDYRGDKMFFNEEENRFELYRMVPPDINRFYFSQGNEDYISDSFWSDISKVNEIGYVNIIEVPSDSEIIANSNHVQPRDSPGEPYTSKSKYDPKKSGSKAKPVEWTMKQSIFAGRRSENDSRNLIDTPEVLAKAFNFDFEKADFSKLIKEESKLLIFKETWLKHYNLLRQIFLYYSGTSTIDEYYGVNLGDFIDLIHDNNMYNAKFLPLKTIENIWRDSLPPPEEEGEAVDIYKVSIDRGKFMELLTKIGITRFSTKKKPLRPVDAVEVVMNDYLDPNCKRCNNNSFRTMTLYRQDIDEVLKMYVPFFKGSYTVLADTKIKGSAKLYLNFDKYIEVLKFCKIIEENISYLFIFNLIYLII